MTRTKREKARRKAIRDATSRAADGKCPTPAKRPYETELAIQNALRSSKRSGKPMRIYKCQCGSLHLTRRLNPPAERKAA